MKISPVLLLPFGVTLILLFLSFDSTSAQGRGVQRCRDLLTEYSRNYRTWARLPTATDPIDFVAYYAQAFNGRNYNLPRAVHAVLTHQHLNCGRRNFGNQFNGQMEAMQQWREDEKGHLIASQLCGPIDWYNLAPQQPSTNRNRYWKQGWITMENDFARYIRRGQRVDMTVLLEYVPPNRRPVGFRVCAVPINPDGTEQGFRNQFFSNQVN